MECDFNFPEGLLSQFRLRLVIKKAHVSLTDPSLQSKKGRGGGEADRQGSQVRMVTSEKPPSTCVGVSPVRMISWFHRDSFPSKDSSPGEKNPVPAQFQFHSTLRVKGCGSPSPWSAGNWQLSVGTSQPGSKIAFNSALAAMAGAEKITSPQAQVSR